MTQLRNVNITTQDSPSIDAFCRWRVSNPSTIFDSKNIFNDPDVSDSAENIPLFYDNQETSGSGTSTAYRDDESSQRLSVSATTTGTRVRQSKQRMNYQPGKSQLVFVTFSMISAAAGITKRAGYFDENNGLYFEANGTDYYVTRRTSTSGSPVNNSVIQASWNLDPLDGTGPSGITADFTKTQILIIDFEWLGVGRVRMGFVIDGCIYYVHEFLNANNLAIVYMKTPNLPVRWEISNDGTGAASSLDCICASVISEGGQESNGIIRYASTTTLVDASVAATTYAIIGIRLKSAYLGASVQLISASLSEVVGSKDLEWRLILNPTVAGSFTYSNLTNSAVQVAYGATANTISGGTLLNGGFFSSANGGVAGTITSDISSALRLGSTIAGTSDEIVLCVRTLAAVVNSDVYGGLTWRELV